jgi:hypothetical protein
MRLIFLAMALYFGLLIILFFGMLSACLVFGFEIWKNRLDNISVDVMDRIENKEYDSNLSSKTFVDCRSTNETSRLCLEALEMCFQEMETNLLLVQNIINLLKCEQNEY